MGDKKKRFVIEFSGEATLSVDQIWPDGNAPENPTVDDVIKAMKDDAHSVDQLLDEWNLDECLSMWVWAVFDRGNMKEVKFP